MASEIGRSVESANVTASRTASTVSDSSSSALDRLSQWYSNNKVLAWTIAGVAVAGTGAAIYYSSVTHESGQDNKQRKSKRERRKEKATQEATKSPVSKGTLSPSFIL